MRIRLGLLILALCALVMWAAASALINDGDLASVLPYAIASLSLVLGVLSGVVLARFMTAVALAVTAVFVVAEVTIGHPGSGPLGGLTEYANAEAAVAVQLAALPLLAGAAADRHRLPWMLPSALLVGVAVLSDSAAGILLGAALLALGALALRVRHPRISWAPAAGAVVIVALSAMQIALTIGRAWPASAVAALSSRRIDLWTDAVTLLRERPLAGHGPGSFDDLSPTAADPDTSAAHSVIMQVLAELGVVGGVILIAVPVLGCWLLGLAQSRPRFVAVGAWSAFWIHGLVDYVLHFPAVVVAAGVVLGAAIGGRRDRVVRQVQPARPQQPARYPRH